VKNNIEIRMGFWLEGGEEGKGSRAESERTMVYHWRCLLMSQKEATVATIVKKAVMIQPTSCAMNEVYRPIINQSIL
jgi:hypothetical protein